MQSSQVLGQTAEQHVSAACVANQVQSLLVDAGNWEVIPQAAIDPSGLVLMNPYVNLQVGDILQAVFASEVNKDDITTRVSLTLNPSARIMSHPDSQSTLISISEMEDGDPVTLNEKFYGLIMGEAVYQDSGFTLATCEDLHFISHTLFVVERQLFQDDGI